MANKKAPKQSVGPDKKAHAQEPNPLLFFGAGLEFAGVVGAFSWIGYWLDGKCGTAPWMLVIGMAMAVIGSTYKLYLLGKRFF